MSAEEARICEGDGCSVEINPDNPKWVTYCKPCYKTNRPDPGPMRACESCEKDKIPAGAPKWKKICGGCYHKKTRGDGDTAEDLREIASLLLKMAAKMDGKS
jgi:hypothetical protein